jgi:hypothetical protein
MIRFSTTSTVSLDKLPTATTGVVMRLLVSVVSSIRVFTIYKADGCRSHYRISPCNTTTLITPVNNSGVDTHQAKE